MTRSSCNSTLRPLLAAALMSAVFASPVLAQAAQETAAPDPQAQSNQPVDDTWITTKVKTELLATEDVPGMEIDVETANGVVALSGSVESQSQADRAVAVAKAVKGVSEVDSTGLVVKAGDDDM